MKLREWLNNNSAVTTIGAVVLLLIALVIMLWTTGAVGGPSAPTQSYFYDVKTHKLFSGSITDLPPIDAPSGKGNGVKAHVFSCTDCSDTSSQFIGWLERYTDRAKKMLSDPNKFAMMGPTDDLVKLPPKVNPKAQWVPAESRAGNMIMSATIRKHCKPTQTIKRCFP